MSTASTSGAGLSEVIDQFTTGDGANTPTVEVKQDTKNEEKHKDHCEHTELSCPISDCSWTDKYCNLTSHYSQNHNELIIGPDGTVPSLSFKLNEKQNLHLLYVDGKRFFLVTVMNDTEWISHSVQGFPCDGDLSKYSYSFIIIHTDDPKLTLLWNDLKVLPFGINESNQISVHLLKENLIYLESSTLKFSVTVKESEVNTIRKHCKDCGKNIDNPIAISAGCGCNICFDCAWRHFTLCFTNFNDPEYIKLLEIWQAALSIEDKKPDK